MNSKISIEGELLKRTVQKGVFVAIPHIGDSSRAPLADFNDVPDAPS